MSDKVQEQLGTASQSRVLLEAQKSNEYQEVPVESNRYQVFIGEDLLLIGVQGEGIYTEKRDSPDNGREFIYQDPWEGRRETKYTVEEGGVQDHLEIYGELDENDFLLDSYEDPGVERWMDSNEPDVVVELRGDKIAMMETGDARVPDFESIEGVEIAEVSKWVPSPGPTRRKDDII